MFKKGDIVRIKSLDNILEIEGVYKCEDIDSPHITTQMLHNLGKEGVVVDISFSGNVVVEINGSAWRYSPKWIDKVNIKEYSKD